MKGFSGTAVKRQSLLFLFGHGAVKMERAFGAVAMVISRKGHIEFPCNLVNTAEHLSTLFFYSRIKFCGCLAMEMYEGFDSGSKSVLRQFSVYAVLDLR